MENSPQFCNTSEYNNVHQLSNSSGYNGAPQYQVPAPVEDFSQSPSHPTMQTNLETDQLGVNIEKIQPSVSMAVASPVKTNEGASVSGSSSLPYIPNSVPISLGSPEPVAPELLNEIK